MQKSKLPLSSLKAANGGKSGGTPQKGCEQVSAEVNGILLQQCSNKFNPLKKCTDCDNTHPDWPVIGSPADAKLFNTAYNGANGFLGQGETDMNWEAGEGTPSSFPTTWIPAWVYYHSSAWHPSPFLNADWISFFKDGKHPADQDFYFRYRFYLASSLDPAQFSLDMDFYADNCVHEIYVNGVAQSTYHPTLLPQNSLDPYNYHGFIQDKEVHIALSNDWKQCDNEIIVHVKSGADWVGFLAQNAFKCHPSKFPELTPSINISWGDSDCDCLETDDFEIMCISVCNPYADVSFNNFILGKISVVDEFGNPVATLPDGTPSVDIHPIGPYCFGNIAPCGDNGPSCVAREFVLFNRGAKSGKYKILLEGVCFNVCKNYSQNTCFEMTLCKS